MTGITAKSMFPALVYSVSKELIPTRLTVTVNFFKGGTKNRTDTLPHIHTQMALQPSP